MNRNLSVIPIKSIFFISTMSILLTYSTCSKKTSTQAPPETPQTQEGQTQGGQTQGDQTQGDQTQGDQTQGDQTQGDQTQGDQTQGDQTQGDQTPDDQTYTVTFNTDGGSEVQSREVNSGDTVARPDNPTKTASIFANWFTDQALTNIYSFSTLVTSDLTLYAKWIPEDATIYELVFNTNGGSNVEPQPIVEGETADEPDDPSREGYSFVHWYSDPDDSSTAYDFTETAVTEDITLYANWLKRFTVTFNTNGGSVVTRAGGNENNSIASIPVDSNAKISAPSQVLSRDGYRFLNWYSDPKAPSTAYEFTETAVIDDITLYANWIKRYTVTFNTNGGSAVADVVVDSNATISAPSQEPNRDGYKFLNWYSNPNAPSVAYNFTETAVTDDITLYVNWLKRFTVTFNMNGGTPVRTQTIDSGKVVKKPTSPTNEAHGGTFEAWYSNRELTTEHKNNTVNSDLTLYAKWEYMVTYDKSTREVTGLAPNLMGSDVHLVIPSNINGLMMESIRNDAFKGNTRILSLKIAEGIEYIGEGAFSFQDIANSRIAGNLVIPNSVVTIGSSAFNNCDDFTGSLTIPSVRTIGRFAFKGCGGFTGSLTLGNSVETIGDFAFRDCSGFTGSLTLGNSVETIGVNAFQDCSGFTGILVIPSSVETIRNEAFFGTAGIERFTFESSNPPTIGRLIFGFTRPVTIIVPNGALEAYRGVGSLSRVPRYTITGAE